MKMIEKREIHQSQRFPLLECLSSEHCPAYSICARGACHCLHGYYPEYNKNTSETFCTKKICNRALDCDKLFVYSACTGPNGTCTCAREYVLDTNMQVCEPITSQPSPWRYLTYGVIGSTLIVGCVLLFFIRKIFLRKRKISKQEHDKVVNIVRRHLQEENHAQQTQTIRATSGIRIEQQQDPCDSSTPTIIAQRNIFIRPQMIHHLEPPPAYDSSYSFENSNQPQTSLSTSVSRNLQNDSVIIDENNLRTNSSVSPLSSKVIGF